MAIKSDNFGKRKKVAREYNPSFVVEVIGGVPRKAPAGITKDAPGTGGYVTKCKVLNPLGNPDVKTGQEVEVVMYPDKTTFDAFVEVDKAKSDIFATAGLEKPKRVMHRVIRQELVRAMIASSSTASPRVPRMSTSRCLRDPSTFVPMAQATTSPPRVR